MRYFNTVRVDLGALAHNLSEVRRIVGPGVKVMAVVKADAYGHGLIPAAQVLARSGADALGVMDLDEGVRLRDAGLELPVYILAGFEPAHCAEIVARDLVPFVFDLALARELDRAAKQAGRRVSAQLKVDTGMNRLGVRPEHAPGVFSQAADLAHVHFTGLASHFSDADLKDSDFVHVQLTRFRNLLEEARRRGLTDLHLNNQANSAAVMSLPTAHMDMVRPGVMLYGGCPAAHFGDLADLHPVMSLTSRVVQVKVVPPGETVSYGRTWTATRETVLATVPVGYTHGYDRMLSNRGAALIRGKRAPVRGRVCMNLTMFDATDIPGVQPGDEVVLLGAQDGNAVTADQWAEMLGTINYEIFCTLGGLNHREYVL